jgi:predicted aminopeptidase
MLVFLGGCSTLGYYGHAASGQLDILGARQPIDELLSQDSTDPGLRKRLQLVKQIRRFAVDSLQLPDSGSFTSYVDLDRSHVLWNVFATPELSLEAKRWCYPFFGCISYRSYFEQQQADAYAAELKAEGLDVYVGAVAAYSTIGWFDDPLYNTLLARDDAELAGIMFHELAHEQLYVKDDTAFNESFAMVVQIEGVRRWLKQQGKAQAFKTYQQEKQREDDFVELLMKYRKRLEWLYATDQTDDRKRTGKQQILNLLRDEHQLIKKARWQGYEGYDSWFKKKLNNASLAPVGTYHQYVPALRTLLNSQAKGDFAAFYKRCKALGELSMEARRNALLPELTAQRRRR